MKIAIIGSGIAGNSAGWLLNQSHEITIYEQSGHIGGHCNTVDIASRYGGPATPIDIGFIVHNKVNYPNLCALFDHVGVLTRSSNMSFWVSLDGGRLEYGGTSPFGLFAAAAQPAPARPLAHAAGGRALLPQRPPDACRSGWRRSDAGSVSGGGRLQRRRLRPRPSAADGCRDLVIPARRHVGFSGHRLYPLLPQSRPAEAGRPSRLARRGRRQPDLCGASDHGVRPPGTEELPGHRDPAKPRRGRGPEGHWAAGSASTMWWSRPTRIRRWRCSATRLPTRPASSAHSGTSPTASASCIVTPP